MSKTLLALLIGTFMVASAHAQVYQWRDAKGKLHFGDQPPPGVTTKQIGGEAQPPAATPEAPAEAEPEPEPALPDLPPTDDASAPNADEAPLEASGDAAPAPRPAPAKRQAPAQPPAPKAAQAPTKAPPTYLEQRKQAEEEAARAAAVQQQKAAQDRDCQQARNQLAALEGGVRMSSFNERGERVVLDDAGRAKQIESTRGYVDMYCK